MSSPQLPDRNTHKVSPLELQTKVDEDLTIKEKAPTRAFSWLKVATTIYGQPLNRCEIGMQAQIS